MQLIAMFAGAKDTEIRVFVLQLYQERFEFLWIKGMHRYDNAPARAFRQAAERLAFSRALRG